MKKENLFGKIKRFNKDIDKHVPGKVSSLKKLGMFIDFTYEYVHNDVYLQDYIQYEFYNKKRRERKRYVVHGKLLEMMRICNNPANRPNFDKKPLFNKAFAEFIHRDWLNAEDATEEEFRQFIKDKECFFVKQPDGMFGLGVQKIYVKDITDVSATFKEYKKNKYLCEELLTQCKEMAEFNDTSINTLRVVTLITADDEVKVMGGLLRVGRKGRIADNFHHQGIASFIDPVNGIVCTAGIDKTNTRRVIHPDSKKQLVGFKIPMWDEIVDTVTKAAKVFPDMRYIGWDVVITEDYKVALIEGNPGADPDAEQITTREGRWPYYYKYLKDIKKLNS